MIKAARALLMLLFLSLTTSLYAGTEPLVRLPEPETPQTPKTLPKERDIKGLLLLGIGGGGFLSSGAQSGAVLFSAEAGFRFRRLFELSLSYRLKASFPEDEAQSLVHACMLEGRGFLWRGLYLGAGLGLAVAELRLAPYQEFTPGAAWLLALGYRHDISRYFGVFGELLATQHYTKGLYTAIGADVGLSVYF